MNSNQLNLAENEFSKLSVFSEIWWVSFRATVRKRLKIRKNTHFAVDFKTFVLSRYFIIHSETSMGYGKYKDVSLDGPASLRLHTSLYLIQTAHPAISRCIVRIADFTQPTEVHSQISRL